MATTPPMIGGSDPSVLRSLETPTPSVARTSPPTVSATTGSATSGGTAVARGIAPQVSGATTTYNQATQTASGTSLTITSATSNDPADVVTVYNTNKAISVSAVNQTVNSYKVNNYAGNEYSNNDVANYLPTFTGNVGAGNVNVTGTVYTSGISSTGSASLTILNVSTTANLGAVGNITITGGSNGQVLTTNGSNVLSWTTVSGGNSSYGNSDVANYLPTFTGNIGANVVTANLFVGSGANLTNIAGANVGGFVPNANVANTAFAVAGANVSGFVPNANVANTAYSVSAANVSGLGNIATINLTGSTSNVLYGNGVFAAIASGNSSQISNGNSNVSISSSSDNVYINVNNGSNKQWIFDTAGNLRAPGNVDIYGAINFPQQVSSLNWSTYNIELSQYGRINTNVDFFANANTIGGLYLKGDGSNISNIAGANVSGTVGNANLSQYLAVSDVNNNFSYHVVLSAGSGDKSLHIDADDNLQYNPSDGTLTATRVDATYVLANLNFANGYLASNLVGSTSNIVNGNSNVSITTANGDITLSAVGTANVLVVTGTGANITGTANVSGTANVGNLNATGIVKTGVFATANIPAAATAGAGARAFVTDATLATFGSAYVGGAANAVPVWSDGSAWYIG